MDAKLSKVTGERPFVLAFAFATLAEAMAALRAIDGLPASSAYQPDAKELHDAALARALACDRHMDNTGEYLPMMPDALAADADDDLGLTAGTATESAHGALNRVIDTLQGIVDDHDARVAGGFMFHTEVD